jgi:two-component system KDP operon response regulator KdpE
LLLIEDDRALLRALRLSLNALGHQVDISVYGEEGLAKLILGQFDLVVLDLGLPDIDGMEVCRRIRRFTSIPVIILSAIGEENRKVEALDIGADDYVTKPFSMPEFQARVRAAIRSRSARPESAESIEVKIGPLVLDKVHHEARLDGTDLSLTGREFDLLLFLAENAGLTCTHQMILRRVWGEGYLDDADSVRTYIYRLRRKLGPAHSGMLATVTGIGYRLSEGDLAN